jgi:hypothetical protein
MLSSVQDFYLSKDDKRRNSMNTSMSNTHVDSMSREDKTKLSNTERMLLLLPMAGGLVFGLGPFLFGSAVGAAVGFPGNDAYLYRLAGAAAFGYAVALIMGIRQTEWAPLRQVVIGTLTFNLASIFACVAALLAGDTNIFVYLILAASIIFIAITASLLNRHGRAGLEGPSASSSAWYVRFVTLGTVLSAAFGLLPLLIPVWGAQLLGFHGTDVFIIRQAGAASLGYAVMGLIGRQTGAWREVRLGLIMALIFNGFSFIASVIALFSGEPILISLVIGAASLFVTIVGTIAYQRKGQL